MKRKIMIVTVLATLLMLSVGFIQPVTASKMGDLVTEKPAYETITNEKGVKCRIDWGFLMGLLIAIVEGILLALGYYWMRNP